jgi:hypothetical protein
MWIITAQTKVVYLKCYYEFLTTLDVQHTKPIGARSLFWGLPDYSDITQLTALWRAEKKKITRKYKIQ